MAIETGVGQLQAERAMSWLLSRPKLGNVAYRPKVVVAAGFCGALRGDVKSGDLILATEVIDGATNTTWPTSWPGDLPPGKWDPPLHRGRVVTAAKLAGSLDEKQSLFKEFDAVAVDMESATLAQLCHQAGVPFGCLRVVLDDAHTPISPKLARLMSGGRASPWRLALALLSSPTLLGELWRLAGQSRMAAEPLGKGLGELLTLTLPWMQS
ncbi:MAG TPA: hypothetical protein VE988_05270 [Gemmataceae bacterium]|nr:hypothetical protein [Gemmataceae bacterium]